MMHNVDKLSAMLPAFADAAIIISPENRRYFTGFPASDGVLLVTHSGAIFYTDSRYTEAAAIKIGSEYVHNSAYMYKELNTLFEEHGIETVAIEYDRMTIADLNELSERLPGTVLNTTSALSNAISDIRLTKSIREISDIMAAQTIAESAFDHILGFIKPGMTEKQIALELDFYMLSNGAEALSFETIAVSGKKSSMPHGVPDNNVIKSGDFITMDFGATVNGYHSDMTRTVVVGKPTEKQISVYNTVLEAQLACLKILRAGITGIEADKAARDVIEKAGYGKYFGHGTGHGVGIEIHEEPRLSPKATTTLQSGNIVTVEPGIYIPGEFGVRIEDMVMIDTCGCMNLTNSPKELIQL